MRTQKNKKHQQKGDSKLVCTKTSRSYLEIGSVTKTCSHHKLKKSSESMFLKIWTYWIWVVITILAETWRTLDKCKLMRHYHRIIIRIKEIQNTQSKLFCWSAAPLMLVTGDWWWRKTVRKGACGQTTIVWMTQSG